MMLIEQTTVPATALPVAEFKDHMRLGTGFADDGAQDALLEALLRAAMAAVEGRTGKALLTRSVSWTITAWRDGCRQAMPVAPVAAITAFRVVDRDGMIATVDTSAYGLEPDTHRPHLVSAGANLPLIPIGGRAEVVFDAGFGATWAEMPADMAQAVMLLAAHYHEHRAATGPDEASMPFGVQALLEPWRTVRILGGAPA
ncbi:gene transfer agent protein [Actibacterium mucosum KCTC 23349]|uniref:Gene transfer agent protein n=1 Tax=Actibacterium mucosum KCTC 23349 TaxID=1454373 RepID=A0A037ZM05_9RHOB|nr:head-tail connector protein [Actibacterium mucosum]KAJ56577.1 gene transfer agent protein [Actibacterium mucosum KCTC 23349]